MEQAGQKEQKEQTKEINVNVSSQVAFSIKMQEFDKRIAEAECVVANLKRDKIVFAYDAQIQEIIKINDAQKAQKQSEN